MQAVHCPELVVVNRTKMNNHKQKFMLNFDIPNKKLKLVTKEQNYNPKQRNRLHTEKHKRKYDLVNCCGMWKDIFSINWKNQKKCSKTRKKSSRIYECRVILELTWLFVFLEWQTAEPWTVQQHLPLGQISTTQRQIFLKTSFTIRTRSSLKISLTCARRAGISCC